MANFSSLQDLYQAAPTMAAFMSGQRFAGEQEASNLTNQQTQQTIDHNAVMNPLNAQFRQGEVANQQALLPGTQADSQMKVNKATIDSATLGQQLQAKTGELTNKLSAQELERTRVLGEKMGALGAALQSVPPAARASMIAQEAQKMGIDINSPYVQTFLKAPPDQMPKLLQDTAQRMALATGDHRRKMHEVETKEAGDTERAKILANARVTGAELGASNKNAGLDPQVIFNKMPTAKGKHAFAVSEAYKAQASGDQNGYQYWSGLANQLRPQAEAEISSSKPGSPDVSQLGIPGQAGPQIAPPGAAQPQPQSQVSNHQYMTTAPKEWGPMDTTKYEYAVINGKLARRPK